MVTSGFTAATITSPYSNDPIRDTMTNPRPNIKGYRIDKNESKRSRATSCERCKRRKQKCDHRLPICTNCLKAGEECIQPEKYALHVPTKDEYTLLLEARVQKLEKEKNELLRLYNTSSTTNRASPQTSFGVMSPLQSGNVHSPTSSVGSSTAPGTVNILNSDPVTGASAPQSFSVVSSLLQETFWGRNKDFDFTQNNVNPGAGLLPDYNFDEYLKYRPIKPPDDVAGAMLLEAFKDRFLFLDRQLIYKLYDERHVKPSVVDDTYRYHSFLLYSVLAIACLTRGRQRGEYHEQLDPFRYYATALRYAKLCQHPTVIWKITALQLCAMVQMRTELDGGQHFEMVSRSMKLCVEIGLHKGDGLENISLYEREMRKRLFWAVYSLERLLTISTGRPFVVPEEEITVDFPLDIEEKDLLEDDTKVQRVTSTPSDQRPTTSMTFTLSIYALRRLESKMVREIYRSEQPLSERLKRVEYYLELLGSWKERKLRNKTSKEKTMACLAYAKSVRLLLQPFLGGMSSDHPLFIKCVEETGRICTVMRDFYRNGDTGFTTIAMHTIFVAGLTLIYCLCLAKGSSVMEILEHLRSCTATLYTLTEKSRLCANYRDTLDTLTAATVRHIKQHKLIEDYQRSPADTSTTTERPARSSPFVPVSHVPSVVGVGTPTQTPPTSDFEAIKETADAVEREIFTEVNNPVTQPIVPQPPSGTINNPISVPSRGWVDSYGYDDTMYNMIQDISSFTQNKQDNGVAVALTPQETEDIWFDLAEFGYS